MVLAPKSERAPSAARRGRGIALAVFTLFTAGFIALSTTQLARQVFGYSTTYPAVTQECAYALRWLEEGIDTNLAKALQEKNAALALESFQNSIRMQRDTVDHKCGAPQDQEAVLAALRLREATSAQIEADYANLARVRRAIDMRIGR